MEAQQQAADSGDRSQRAFAAARAIASRATGISFGLGTQALFAWTVWQLYFFLAQGVAAHGSFHPGRNALLALQFAVSHSLMLWPPFSSKLRHWVPAAFYGNLFCVVTCVSLLLMFRLWSSAETGVWHWTGLAASAMSWGFYASWAALFYSLSLTGLGYQTGWTQWWHWFRRRPQPQRSFRPRGVYHWMRHPVYLSFLGLIWFTPNMTWDRVVLTAVWTVYIFAGSYWKDRRLVYYMGDAYRAYAARVTGFPLIGWGPWGRWAVTHSPSIESSRALDSDAHQSTAA